MEMDTGVPPEPIISSLKKALETRITYGPEDANVTIVLSNYAAKGLLEDLKNLPNMEDDVK